ncbi:MAG: 4-methyl-5(B-hydroxyethyl)-thiazole monophosphate biosynthesis protein [Crenarchaeota archaeon]|nr:MAG: 4-methyl-5(B-hydroxyethyl)-thiazole monophosphate biosynthesis protein [Thermoproteota archaeon]RDJ33516.1 MAG: 4-methyl-5(B-hydroxyethyl)-thiazole monophosphate biosynthesis protein [Thermoproteota archaeon]RDJ36084.1 MAG: 4-methyl-5(B-hydroxyethyl)-thiazole monophosphate biosynthesis protein [Thermoproteota archaeon]RDJ38165.1 MAG: 4-methyl-5(B-hydroxyethyl)-thiazole monophosphate biosynthesis protein [Thermoproteota archaeon]
MSSLTFTIPSVLNQGGGEKKIEISADTLSDAFSKISETMGDDFKRRILNDDGTPRSLINIYINGKNAKFSDGMNTTLKDGDEIYILPAVAGGSELSNEDLDRYSRQVMLEEIGYQGQIKLCNAKVCVVGVGGLGNPITTRLVAMGVGKIRIVDRDIIEFSNLHRQTLFDESDVGEIKVEAAAKKLKKLNSGVNIEALAVSVNDYNASEIIEGCDIVIDALDSVNARYALNKACIENNIPFVTGAAVGVSGQVFTILPKETACYHCMFPALDEDTMPTCSIEGVHPSILSIVGGIEVAEAVKILIGKKPSLSNKILHIDLENLDFSTTRTFRAEECPVCGSGKKEEKTKQVIIIEELCGRNRGKRTFSLTPTQMFDIDVKSISKSAKEKGFLVENQGNLGLSLRTNDLSVSFMKKGSAVIVGTKDENDAIELYSRLTGKKIPLIEST